MSYFQCHTVAEMTAGRCRRTFAATITGVAVKGVFAIAIDKAFFFEMPVKDFSHLTTIESTSSFVVTLEKGSQANVRNQQPKTPTTLSFSDAQYTVVSLVGSKWELASSNETVPLPRLVIRSLADVTGAIKPGAVKSSVFTTVVVAEKVKTYERRALSAATVAVIGEGASQAPPLTQFPGGEKDHYVTVVDVLGCGESFTLRLKEHNVEVMNGLVADGATPTVLISNMGLFASSSERGFSLSVFLGSCIKLLPDGASMDAIAADVAAVANVLPHLAMAAFCDGPFSVRMVEIREIIESDRGQKTPAKRGREAKVWVMKDSAAVIPLTGAPTTFGEKLRVDNALFVDGRIDLSNATVTKEVSHLIA